MVGPLTGFRVLDFSWIIAGPFATRTLAELGAEVIKVEQPGTGDFYRQGDLSGSRPSFAYWNYGKRSISVNLRDPRGVDLCRRLAGHCDVVVENFRPGTMDRLGLGADALQALNPRLIYCGISGFGATGPDAGRPLHAPTAHAMSGIMTMVGEEGDPPFQPAGRLADPLTGIQAALAICAALAGRERTGKGSRIDLSVMDSLVWMLGPLAEQINMPEQDWQQRPGHLHTNTVPGGTFRGKDGWLVIGGGLDEAHWKRLANAIGRPDLAGHLHAWRHSNQDEIYRVLGDWLMAQPSVEEAERHLHRHDVICSKVNTTREMVQLPFLHERGTIEKIDHRDYGEQYVTNSPFHFAGENPHWVGPAPRAGEHNAEVFTGILGLSLEEVEALEAQGVLFKAPKAD